MSRLSNPVFREGIRIYLIEGEALKTYFYYLMIFAPIPFLTLLLPSFDPLGWMGSAHLFRLSSVVALVLMVYFTLRFANQEFVPWRFLPLRHWLYKEGVTVRGVALGQLALVCLQALVLAILTLPLLTWAGAIARTPPGSILAVLFMLLFYSLTYGVWGLVSVALWERRVDSRQVFVRSLFAIFIFISALLYFPLNPVMFLFLTLGGKEMAPLVLWGWEWSPAAVHFLFHIILLASGLFIYRWSLKRESYY